MSELGLLFSPLLLILSLISLAMPFFVWGIYNRTKATESELKVISQILLRQTDDAKLSRHMLMYKYGIVEGGGKCYRGAGVYGSLDEAIAANVG